MSDSIQCWKCGAGLENLILPMSRREECPSCGVDQHVCRLCRHFDPALSGACSEDRAESVTDKEKSNFCDYFEPRPDAFKSASNPPDTEAKAQLAALFGDEQPVADEPKANTDHSAEDALRALFDDDTD